MYFCIYGRLLNMYHGCALPLNHISSYMIVNFNSSDTLLSNCSKKINMTVLGIETYSYLTLIFMWYI